MSIKENMSIKEATQTSVVTNQENVLFYQLYDCLIYGLHNKVKS